MSDLLSVNEARTKILDTIKPLPIESTFLDGAFQRILAEDIISQFDFPVDRTSSMDGFAVRYEDIQESSQDHPSRLEIVDDILAGFTPNREIGLGQCARIMTGAVIPIGANVVIPVEWTSLANSGMSIKENWVEIYQPALPDMNIRSIGQDIRAGEILMRSGAEIEPHHLALLATVGINVIRVHKKPRVAIISSGSELLVPGVPLEPGKVYNANSFSIQGLVRKQHCEVVDLGIARDDPDEIMSLFDRAVAIKADLIVSSAGVSVGAFDFIRPLLERNGVMNFWRVNMRPGKPLAYGSYRTIPWLGLPGNPVSAFIDFMVFGTPALAKLRGKIGYRPTFVPGILTENVESDGRESYLRVIAWSEDNGLKCKLTGHQGSGNIYSLVQANALLIVPSGVKSLPAGSIINLWMIE